MRLGKDEAGQRNKVGGNRLGQLQQMRLGEGTKLEEID